ncbi:MAG TPA: ATP-binding protein [Rhizomicrobium sp.]|jgi:signal transduction histidine kinase|nr:ATP-binding protein [Rhizomicrobium sp.]
MNIRSPSKWLPYILTAVLCAAAASVAAAPDQTSGSQSWNNLEGTIAKAQRLMMADPAAALASARDADTIAKQHISSPQYREARAKSLWLEAEALTRLNRLSDAQVTLDRAVQFTAHRDKLSKLDGDLELTRARLANASGDIALALKSYQHAYAIFVRLGIPRSQSIALLGLGGLYDKAHDFPRAIRYYREASQVYSGDPALDLSAANNIGFALQQMGRYDDAIQDFHRALKIASALDSPVVDAHILTNLAISNARIHQLAEADRNADEALRILKNNDERGESRFAWGVKAEIAYRRGAIAAAADDLQRAFHGLDLKTTTAQLRDIHEIAFRVYRANGNLPLAVAHLEAFKRLDDEGRSLASSSNLALMSAQFDFANQRLEIEQLKSAELERDISLRKSRETLLMLSIVGILLAGAVVIAWIAWQHASERRHRSIVAEKNRRLTETLSNLRVAMDAALQASRAKSHFLANMSHELRTPLNAIIGFSEIIMSSNIKPEKSREYASNVVESGRRLLSTVNDVLDMARLEAGTVSLSEDTVSLADVVDHAKSALSSEQVAKRQIRFAPGNRNVFVRGDKARLQQVAVNLVSNAVKFTPPEAGRVDIIIEQMPNGVDLVIRDNGNGISPDKLAAIMEPFGQAESAYARSHQGAGLGLPMVKVLTELHGGWFMITSAENEGTEARVHLPGDRVLEMTEAGIGSSLAPLTTTAAA